MSLLKPLSGLLLALAFPLAAGEASAHCDGEDGPVARAVYKALETGNINLVLPYAPLAAEAELKSTFADASKARTLGPAARKVADRLFLETAIRLHRAGEGAPFTGLKPAGLDYGPMVPAAEKAIATGNLQPVKSILMEEVDHVLGERLAHIRELRDVPVEPKAHKDVAAARERISAELGFIIFAEGLHQAAISKAPLHHEE